MKKNAERYFCICSNTTLAEREKREKVYVRQV
jgi:hypothetical protein